MKVFIGWSGTRSQALALALRDWLPLVLHYVDSWLSETDIAAGERWAEAVAKELEASNFGIICITGENLTSPWILFEAGSLAKSLQSSRVIPLLLDLEFSEISGPLAQFQAKKVDEEGLSEVIHSINLEQHSRFRRRAPSSSSTRCGRNSKRNSKAFPNKINPQSQFGLNIRSWRNSLRGFVPWSRDRGKCRT